MSSVGSARTFSASAGWAERAIIPSSGGAAAKITSTMALRPDPETDRTVVARAVHFLKQPRRDHERWAKHREVVPPRAAACQKFQ